MKRKHWWLLIDEKNYALACGSKKEIEKAYKLNDFRQKGLRLIKVVEAKREL